MDPIKYDDASWHYRDFSGKDLPEGAGATHTGMFVAWALLSGFSGDLLIHEFPEIIENLKARSVTLGQSFLEACDGKFTNDDLSAEGNAFAMAYFDFQNGQYINDYEATVGNGLADLYYVADTWENFDRLKPVLDQRLQAWQKSAIRLDPFDYGATRLRSG